MCVRANSLLHGLQRCVRAHGIQLKEGGLEPLHEISNGLGPSHSNVKQIGEGGGGCVPSLKKKEREKPSRNMEIAMWGLMLPED